MRRRNNFQIERAAGKLLNDEFDRIYQFFEDSVEFQNLTVKNTLKTKHLQFSGRLLGTDPNQDHELKGRLILRRYQGQTLDLIRVASEADATLFAVDKDGDITGTSVTLTGLTASRLLATDASKVLVSTITLANLASSVSDVTGTTGTNKFVLDTSPTLVTPNIGAATGTSITVNGAAGTERAIWGTTGGTSRWKMVLGDAAAESGSDAGSNFILYSRTDAGAVKTEVVKITRSTGLVTLANSLSVTGDVTKKEANGQGYNIKSLTELTTIAAAATTDTAIQIPVNAIVFAVSVRVTVAIPTATTFTVTGTTSATQFDVAGGVAVAVNTTDVGTRNCPYKNGAAQTIRITPDMAPAANTGRVRVTIHYYDITVATS